MSGGGRATYVLPRLNATEAIELSLEAELRWHRIQDVADEARSRYHQALNDMLWLRAAEFRVGLEGR